MNKRKLGRVTSHRLAMFKNLTRDLFAYGKVRTTYHRAKELEHFVGKYISKARGISEQNSLHIKRQLFAYFGEDLTKKILNEVVGKFDGRNGGFTRISKLGPRRGDCAEMALIEFCF